MRQMEPLSVLHWLYSCFRFSARKNCKKIRLIVYESNNEKPPRGVFDGDCSLQLFMNRIMESHLGVFSMATIHFNCLWIGWWKATSGCFRWRLFTSIFYESDNGKPPRGVFDGDYSLQLFVNRIMESHLGVFSMATVHFPTKPLLLGRWDHSGLLAMRLNRTWDWRI